MEEANTMDSGVSCLIMIAAYYGIPDNVFAKDEDGNIKDLNGIYISAVA